jgi:hypothetical protein
MTPVLDDRKGLRQAAEVLGSRLGALGHEIDPDDEAELIAAVVGARDWKQLARFVDDGILTVPFRRDRHDHLRAELAGRLSAAAGIPEDDAFLVLEAMPDFAVADIASFAADTLEAFLVRGDIQRFGTRVIEFFGRHPALSDEIDVALRLRDAGKREIGVEAAIEERSLDIMDVLNQHPSLKPLGLAIMFYAVPPDRAAGYDGPTGRFMEGHPDLVGDYDGQRRIIELLSVILDGPADLRFSHLFVSDIIGLPEGMPMPNSVEELRHAMAYHARIAPVLDELFASERPFEIIESGDLDEGSYTPWTDLNIAVAASLRRSKPGAAFEAVADFVNAYGTGTGTESHEVSYDLSGGGVLDFLRDCEALAGLAVVGVSALIASGELPFSADDGGGDKLEAAIGRFESGQKPRRKRARPTEAYRPDELNPEDVARLEELGGEIRSVLGKSARTGYGI